MKITVILTCYNRKEKTSQCISSLKDGNPEYDLDFIVVDDNSTDGTRENLLQLGGNVKVIEGPGNLFWAGGMRVGIDYFFHNDDRSEYVLLVNDDVEFKDNILWSLITKSKQNKDAVIVGATCNSYGEFTYGGMILENPKKRGIYRHVGIEESDIPCDLFNCNCVLIKSETIKKTGNFDSVYIHGMADLDYGLRLSRSGVLILSSDEYVGNCEKNSTIGTWKDKNLSRMERLRKKETPKGTPFKIWFYYLFKNFGLFQAIKYSVSSYTKILLKK